MSTDDRRTPPEDIDDLVAAARSFEPTEQDVDALMAGLPLGGPSGGGAPTESPAVGRVGSATGTHGGMIATGVGMAVGIVAVVAAVHFGTSPAVAPQPLPVATLSAPLAEPAPSGGVAPATSAAPVSSAASAAPDVRPSAAPAKPMSVSTAPAAQDLGIEAEMLHRARAVMRNDPARALAILSEHRSRFPRGVLAEERDALRVEALARLGKSREAERENDRFRREHPDSVHADRINTVLSRESDAGAK